MNVRMSSHHILQYGHHAACLTSDVASLSFFFIDLKLVLPFSDQWKDLLRIVRSAPRGDFEFDSADGVSSYSAGNNQISRTNINLGKRKGHRFHIRKKS